MTTHTNNGYTDFDLDAAPKAKMVKNEATLDPFPLFL